MIITVDKLIHWLNDKDLIAQLRRDEYIRISFLQPIEDNKKALLSSIPIYYNKRHVSCKTKSICIEYINELRLTYMLIEKINSEE